MPVADPPRMDEISAFATVEAALEDHEERDLREDRGFMEALDFLQTRLWKPYPAEKLRRALDLAHPWERYEAASAALTEIRRASWLLAAQDKPRRREPGTIVLDGRRGPPRRPGFD